MTAKKEFAKRVRDIQVSATKQMPIMASSIPNAVSLGQGIPSMPTPKYIKDQVIEYLRTSDDIGKYSLQPGLPELKAAVAKRLAVKTGRSVDAEKEVFISAGGMEALLASVLSIVERGDEVILFDPGYASHIEQVLLAEGVPVFVPLEKDNNWSVPATGLQEAVTKKTKAIIVCNPANPTGKVFSEKELEDIVNVAKEHNLFVITDETYDFLTYDKAPYKSLTSYEAIKDQVIACYSFSKEFVMTGWRVGYIYASPAVISQTLKVHDAAVICAPTISQYAALAALTGADEAKERKIINSQLIKRRAAMCKRLDQLPDLFSYSRPMGAYYVFARYLKTDLKSWDFAVKLLRETGVITIPGSGFGPNGEGHIRLSFGSTEEQIHEAFDRIERWNNEQ